MFNCILENKMPNFTVLFFKEIFHLNICIMLQTETSTIVNVCQMWYNLRMRHNNEKTNSTYEVKALNNIIII